MSISYDIEIAGKNCRDEIFATLVEAGVEFTVEKDIQKSDVIGFFSESGMRVFYSDDSMDDWSQSPAKDQALTMDDMVEDWSISARISLIYRNSVSELCDQEIRNFVSELNSRVPSNFVLSFQYDKVYAIKKDGHLKWLVDF
jgi:hypothetical protein